jgi:predicted dehydrogenase
VPFIIEKPAGLNAAEVRALCERARARGLFVAVPLVQEFGPLAALQTAATRHPGPFHVWFRFVAGPPSRYPASGSPWMLDPAQSGGGCLINLAAHFLHLALKVLPRVSRVWARMSSAVYREPVEDHALVVLEGSDGGSAVIETGYLFPAGSQRPREVYYSLLGRDACYVWWGDRAGHAISGHPWSEEPVNLDSDPLYPEFLRATLAAFQAGHPAPVELDALVPLMEVIDTAYASARSGQPIAVSITAARDRDV